MTLPLYRDHQAPGTLPEHGHRGLWYERFFDRYNPAPDWTVPEEGKLKWIQQTAAKPAGDAEALDQAVQRQLALVTALGGRGAVFQADWHFATGLGLPHPVENGFAWHPTLGVPYLAGSAVKGLVRAWVEIWDDTLDEAERKRRLDTWFGFADQSVDTDDESQPRKASQAGAFRFFDALPIRPVSLRADVMTPHQGKWYEQGGEIEDWRHEPGKVPADWHAPVPVPFLVATSPQLLFAIAPRQAAAASELPQVFKALKQALEWLGAGAKTAVGYGLMQADAKQTEGLEQKLAEAQKRAEMERLSPQQQVLMTVRAELETYRRDDVKPDAGGVFMAKIRQLLDQGLEWPEQERAELATLIEAVFSYAGWGSGDRKRDRKARIAKLRA